MGGAATNSSVSNTEIGHVLEKQAGAECAECAEDNIAGEPSAAEKNCNTEYNPAGIEEKQDKACVNFKEVDGGWCKRHEIQERKVEGGTEFSCL